MRDQAWLGPYDIDGDTVRIRRGAPDSAPHDLFRVSGRLWELFDAKIQTLRLARMVLDNDASDEEGVARLIGSGFPVRFVT